MAATLAQGGSGPTFRRRTLVLHTFQECTGTWRRATRPFTEGAYIVVGMVGPGEVGLLGERATTATRGGV